MGSAQSGHQPALGPCREALRPWLQDSDVVEPLVLLVLFFSSSFFFFFLVTGSSGAWFQVLSSVRGVLRLNCDGCSVPPRDGAARADVGDS